MFTTHPKPDKHYPCLSRDDVLALARSSHTPLYLWVRSVPQDNAVSKQRTAVRATATSWPANCTITAATRLKPSILPDGRGTHRRSTSWRLNSRRPSNTEISPAAATDCPAGGED